MDDGILFETRLAYFPDEWNDYDLFKKEGYPSGEEFFPICEEYKPEFILISAGFDTHWTDRLTEMNWTYQAPANYLIRIKTIAYKYAKDRILITLEGGYNLDKQARAVYNCLRVLNDENEKILQEEPRSSRIELLDYFNNKLIPAIKDKLKPFWKCF